MVNSLAQDGEGRGCRCRGASLSAAAAGSAAAPSRRIELRKTRSDTLITDMGRRPRDELARLLRRPAAERTPDHLHIRAATPRWLINVGTGYDTYRHVVADAKVLFEPRHVFFGRRFEPTHLKAGLVSIPIRAMENDVRMIADAPRSCGYQSRLDGARCPLGPNRLMK